MCEFWRKINEWEAKNQSKRIQIELAWNVKKKFSVPKFNYSVNQSKYAICFIGFGLSMVCVCVCVKLVLGQPLKAHAHFNHCPYSRWLEPNCLVFVAAFACFKIISNKKFRLCKTTEKQSSHGNWNRHQPISAHQSAAEQKNKYKEKNIYIKMENHDKKKYSDEMVV